MIGRDRPMQRSLREVSFRKSPRIPGFDYSSENYYFVTICTHEKQCCFYSNGSLNHCGKTAQRFLSQIPEHFTGVKVDKYVVMPNHMHAIVIIEQDCTVALPTIIGQYKSAVSRHSSVSPLWQRSFHDHVIRNQISYEKIWNYIDTNPIRWNEDCFYV